VKLECNSSYDVKERSLVFGEKPSVGFIIESNEDLGVVDSCFNILVYFVVIAVNFLSFIIEFGHDEVPVGESR
jgi:hypothetical protein